jgi:hypothetical protein
MALIPPRQGGFADFLCRPQIKIGELEGEKRQKQIYDLKKYPHININDYNISNFK